MFRPPNPRFLPGLLLITQLTGACGPGERPDGARFPVVETTIAEVHSAMREGRLTARELVEIYLDRIEAYDKRGPAINAIIRVNPKAVARADSLDRHLAETGSMVGPLHGIPMIVKDNYDTHDLPTTAGSRSLEGSIPPDDAFQVRRIREAGAIVLAKSNMYEFAFSPYHTVGSALPGHTLNPYALNRVPAGSSGGTAAAVSANLGVVGLGTDTGNSIRGPSSHTSLVGIRSTMGLTSRDGIVPLYLDRDIGGPMARTVTDAVAVLDVIAGYDPADPITEGAGQHRTSYTDHLDPDGLSGRRIGVVRQISDREGADPEVLARFREALETMRAAGAEIIDPANIPEQDAIPLGERWCPRFKYDLNAYLESLGTSAPMASLQEVIESGQFHPYVRSSLEFFQGIETPPESNDACRRARENQERLRVGVRRVMSENGLDVLVHPTWSNPPRLIGDLVTPHGDNSQYLAPHTGFPAITVPMGFVRDSLPVGLQIIGDAWSEPALISVAYAYEQASRHRRPPLSAPELP